MNGVSAPISRFSSLHAKRPSELDSSLPRLRLPRKVGRASGTSYTRTRPEGLPEGTANKYMSKSMSAFRTIGDTLAGPPHLS